MHPRLAEITEYLAQVRRDLTQLIADTPSSERDRIPEGGGWTFAQLVEHLGKVEGSIAKMLEGLFTQALAAGLPPETETGSVMAALDRYRIPDSKFFPIEAPERLVPATAPDFDACWTKLQVARHRLLDAVERVDGFAIGTLQAPHPAIGPLDGYAWVLFVGQHEERHLRQMRDGLTPPAASPLH
jgi:hypothetical protein